MEYASWGNNEAPVSFYTVLFQQLNGAVCRWMPPLLVGGAQLQRRNQFAVALQFRLGQDAGLALVGAVGCLGLCRRTRAR